jgi:ribosomal protein S18 acetylase RimI-like enzyme
VLTVALETDPFAKRRLQERLTALLPQWFGRAAANRKYAAQSEILPGYVAQLDGNPKGLLLYKRYSGVSAEIYWLGVDPHFHRSGVGRALVDAAAGDAASDGVRFLFLFTLHPSVDYEPYRRTRLFYEAMGFRYVLEEQFPDETSPLAVYMKQLPR